MFIFNHVPMCRRCVFENWKQNIIEIDRFLVAFRSSVYTMLFIKFSFREIWVIHLLGGEIWLRLRASLFQISRAQCTCGNRNRQWRWRARSSIPGPASDRKVIILQSVKLIGHHSHKIHLIPSQVLWFFQLNCQNTRRKMWFIYIERNSANKLYFKIYNIIITIVSYSMYLKI